MKGVRKRILAVLLSCFILIISVAGKCQVVGAASVVGPATAGGISAAQTLEFLYSVLMSMGITLNLKEMIRYHDPTDGYTWLDDPASQSQIDEVSDKIGEYYDNAVKDWHEKHGGKITPSPEPTKTPDSSLPSPVTPAPTSIPPDISEKIDSWNEMKKKAMANRVLTMTAVAGACLKEAVGKWWDDIMDTEEAVSSDKNPYSYADCIGYQQLTYTDAYGTTTYKTYAYNYSVTSPVTLLYGGRKTVKNYETDQEFYWTQFNTGYSGRKFLNSYKTTTINGKYYSSYKNAGGVDVYMYCNSESVTSLSEEYHWYIPYTLDGTTIQNAEPKPLAKSSLWVNPNLKALLDDNKKSPDLPVPVSVQLPSIDEIKDLNKDAADTSDDDRPTIIQTFINNHKYSAPEPTQSPDPDPNPTGSPGTDPDPTGSPETTPSVTPAVPGDIDVKPTQKPGTGTGTGTGTGGDPSNPDDSGSDGFDVNSYKTDLRLVFPFCIPFDLIHLLNVLDTEPEAPRFEIPIDIVVNNPFPSKVTDGAMIDYHTTMVIDMSDYEQPIKVIRIFEIIFFILGLMLITRQQMIKG